MNKSYFLLPALIFLISCFSLISFVSATDIAYVVKNINNLDSNFINSINELGYSYDLIDDSEISSTDFSEYKMILIGDNGVYNVPVDDYNSLVANNYYFEDWSRSIGSTQSTHPLKAYNIWGESLITQGLGFDFKIYTSCCSNSGVSIPVHHLSGTKYGRVRGIVSGANLGDYIIAIKENPRRVFFGITRSNYWTAESKLLFKNSIIWVIGGNDEDGDGYKAVASGGNDCDDEDDSVHPGAVEILDDIDQNCVNDKPILVEDIGTIVLNNGSELLDAVDLNDYFADYDGDELNFEIYDSSGNEDINAYIVDGVVSFEFPEGWNGEEWIIFKADDRNHNVRSNQVALASSYEPTCSELGGNICSVGQSCSSSWLNAGNSNRCCPVICSDASSFEFDNIKDRMEESGEISLEIKEPANEAKFEVGSYVDLMIKVENNADKDLKFDLEIYLYDLTENKIVDDWDVSFKIDDEEKKEVEFNFKVAEDLNEAKNYAVFVKAVEEDSEYYAEDYATINVERGDDNVIVERIDILEDVVCGEYIDVNVRVWNIGIKDKGVYVEVTNPELGINKKSGGIALKAYDGRDSEYELFNLKIPDDADDGKYILRATVYYDSGNSYLEKELILEGCKIQAESSEISKVVMLNVSEPVKIKKNPFGPLDGVLIWSFTVLVLMMALMIIGYFKFRK